MNVVRKIENTKTKKPGDKPEKDVVISNIEVSDVPVPFAVDKGDATH